MDIRGIIKTKDIEMVDGTSTVADVVGKMMDRRIGSVIVKRNTTNEPYGIITRRDVLFRVIAEGLDPREVKATEIMSSPVVILNNVDLDVRYAAKAMANAGVSNLVIFDGGDVYGFLSSTDIIDAIRMNLTVKALASNTEDISGGC